MKPKPRETSLQEALAAVNGDQRRMMNRLVSIFARQLHSGLLRDESQSPGLEACIEGLEDLWQDGYINFCYDGVQVWMEFWDENLGRYVQEGCSQ